jgi:tetratricopeptide (TPR) repeat protein
MCRQSGNRLQEATSLRRLAIAYMSANQHERALPYARSALDLHRELGDRAEECHALNVLGLIATWVGTPAEAESYLRHSIELSEEIGADQSLVFATENLIWNHYWRHGLLESGLHYLDGQLELPLVINDDYLTNSMLSTKADLYIHLGQYDKALSLIDQVYQFLESTSGLLYQAKTLSARARVWIELGNFPQAFESIEAAGTLLEGIEIPSFQGGINSLKAYYYLHNNPGHPELETALSLVEQAIEHLAGTDDFIDLCVAYSIGGLVLLELDQPEKALTMTTEAVKIIENTPFPREDFLYAHSTALRAANQTEAANRYLDLAYDRVRLVAGNTLDDHLREGWLSNVRINRQILSDSRLYLGKPENGS